MQSDCRPLDEHRLEGLDRQAVQGRGTVQHHRMPPGHLFQDVPDISGLAVDHLLG